MHSRKDNKDFVLRLSRRRVGMIRILPNFRRIFRRFVISFLCAGLLFATLFPVVSAAAVQEKKVLFIFADGPDYPYTKMMIDGFHRVANQQTEHFRILYYYEYLETTRFLSDPSYMTHLAEFLQQKYRRNQPDLIVLHGLSTNDYMAKYGVRAFPGVPAIYTAYAFDREKTATFPFLYTGVVAPFDINQAIDTIVKVQPNTRKIYLILGASEDEQKVTAQYKKELAARKTKLQFVWLNDLPLDQLLQTVQSLETQSAIQFINFHRDVSGNVFIPAQILRRIAHTANAPLYGTLQTHLGTGAVGGHLISFTAMGAQAAEIGLSLFAGEPQAMISAEVSELTENVFDWRALNRWKIDERSLPENSRVEFQQKTVWEEYKNEISRAIFFVLLLLGWIGFLLRSRFISKRSAKAIRESEERYRAIMQQSSDAIAMVDIENRRVIEANPKWLSILGYQLKDVSSLCYDEVLFQTQAERDNNYERLLADGALPPAIVRLKRRDGILAEAEQAASVIHFSGKQVFVFVNRDLAAERQLQYQIQQDVMLAAEVQKSLLPQEFDDVLISLETIFEPFHQVSGDYFNFAWNLDHTKFYGFVVDISGHGVASSLQGQAVNSYIREIMEAPINLVSRLNWVNQKVLPFFTEGAFAAAVCFEFDFARKTLSFSTAGIYAFLASSASLPKIVCKPGSLLGITSNPEFEEWLVPLAEGDAFYFMTDGLSEQLPPAHQIDPNDFDRTVSMLRTLSHHPDRHDDCCALCVKIKGRPAFPLRFQFERPREYQRIRNRIRNLLREFVPKDSGKIEVALGEALTNAMRESLHVELKLSLFGSLLVVRIRDNGPGFAGNAKVAEFLAANREEAFSALLHAEGGRGILIMVAWMDRVIYNRRGNEVMLVKKCRDDRR